eukprot:scaffold168431_cov30-Tisochrysis_lutea.AAC.1
MTSPAALLGERREGLQEAAMQPPRQCRRHVGCGGDRREEDEVGPPDLHALPHALHLRPHPNVQML